MRKADNHDLFTDTTNISWAPSICRHYSKFLRFIKTKKKKNPQGFYNLAGKPIVIGKQLEKKTAFLIRRKVMDTYCSSPWICNVHVSSGCTKSNCSWAFTSGELWVLPGFRGGHSLISQIFTTLSFIDPIIFTYSVALDFPNFLVGWGNSILSSLLSFTSQLKSHLSLLEAAIQAGVDLWSNVAGFGHEMPISAVWYNLSYVVLSFSCYFYVRVGGTLHAFCQALSPGPK